MTKYLFTLCIFIISCSSFEGQRQIFSYVYQFSRGGYDLEFPDSFYSSYKYAAIGVKPRRGAESFLVLEKIHDDIYQYISNDLVYINLYKGLILSTNGFYNDIKYTKPHLDLLEHSLINQIEYNSEFFTIDLANPQVLGLVAESSLDFIKYEDINFQNNIRKVMVYEEIITIESIRWKFKNKYWVDAKDGILKSVYEMHSQPKIQIRQLITAK